MVCKKYRILNIFSAFSLGKCNGRSGWIESTSVLFLMTDEQLAQLNMPAEPAKVGCMCMLCAV